MLYLCEKYAPLESLERYDPIKDISVTGVLEPYDINAGVGNVPSSPETRLLGPSREMDI
jgi:hypothetical protein